MEISKPKTYCLFLSEQWFQNLLDKMDEIYKPEYPNKTYYTIKGDIYMIYDSKNGYLWYSYNKIYSVFKEKYGLNYQQMNELIKGMVEQHCNLRGITPCLVILCLVKWVEQHCNLRGITPFKNSSIESLLGGTTL